MAKDIGYREEVSTPHFNEITLNHLTKSSCNDIYISIFLCKLLVFKILMLRLYISLSNILS